MSSLITVDWGTSSFRLTHITYEGRVIETLCSDQGISKLSSRNMKPYLCSQISKINADTSSLPIIACGMVGSTIGWQETDYVNCPIAPIDLANSLVSTGDSDLDLLIVPGLKCSSPLGQPDVMRGEETQVVGWLSGASKEQKESSLLCLPGTHSKWVDIRQGQITNFCTAFTGELFACLNQHSILVKGDQSSDEKAFEAGVEISRESLSLSHTLFSARSRMLDGLHDEKSCRSYLSGLLIGAEVKASMDQWSDIVCVQLIGGSALTDLYVKVFDYFGVETNIHNGELMSARGLLELYLSGSGS